MTANYAKNSFHEFTSVRMHVVASDIASYKLSNMNSTGNGSEHRCWEWLPVHVPLMAAYVLPM
jgi:hypothetical protein